MHREISETIKICIELVTMSVIVGIVVVLSGLTSKAENIIVQYETAKAVVQDEAALYYYNNKLVTGADVVDCILKYPRTYDFKVTIGDKTYTFDRATEISSKLGLELWSEDYILTVVKPDDLVKSFRSEIIRDDTGYTILGVRFERE